MLCCFWPRGVLWWVHSGGVHDPGCESDEMDNGAHTGDEGDIKTTHNECAGTAPTTPPTRGNGRVVVDGCGWSGDDVMAAGMFGSRQSTMEDGGAWGVEQSVGAMFVGSMVAGVVVVMPLLWTWLCVVLMVAVGFEH